MQLSRRGAATVGLYNFMQQRAPSAAPTHASLSSPPPQNPSPGWSILLLSLSFESEFEARRPPFPIHVTVAANYFWPRHRRFYRRSGAAGGVGIAICMESVRSFVRSFVPGFSSPLVFFLRGHGLSRRFSNFLPSFFFLPLFLSLVSFSIYVHACMHACTGICFIEYRNRDDCLLFFFFFFPLDRDYGKRNSAIPWNGIGSEIEPNRR